ncbi:RagB/SusD family nutrient uptake outer membrane protein [Chitinophaga rhizophila]|uniref:RagB/SusD family nutrient uptake outer membrane protein n=1 Tax=Chitinophaga rhizophila TaxID=2866212 RepID=A0ABS7GHF0_9BACT|nr:RagB/SusD family nutrient uptake outer membrane protein [Chitinophaga rhizophila]MBW8687128.1 RagB/SusD family nutrient uptake outer membrane protein [Chitinophaga rhizophila]
MLNLSLHKKLIAGLLLTGCTFSSCRKLVEIGPPVNQVGLDQSFASDATATSAILGIYNSSSFREAIFAMSAAPGLSADELQNNISSPTWDEFRTNALTITNANVSGVLWYNQYYSVAQANAMIAGIERSTTLSTAVKNQLLGETKTMRAFFLFQLVNYFGDVPLPLTDDPIGNSTLPRTPAAQVWQRIITDLKDAVALLTDTYPSVQRSRVNRQVANALLAKAYLYTKDWQNAEATANTVITSGIYSLSPDVNTAFVNTSNEIIWQFATLTGVSIFTTNTDARGGSYAAPAGVVPGFTLTDTLYNSMEEGDLRKANWVTPTVIGGTNYNVINKYKIRVLPSGTANGNEFNVALRLAEQYLIRGEARARQGNRTGAIADADSIRKRANLPMLDVNLTNEQVLLAIENERKAELFGEWGNRWFDLKRNPSVVSPADKTRADDVIGGLRPATWNVTDILYPIPDAQRTANPALTQNLGY